jgi:Relaxase/Mobilisation nuclease domain
MLLDTRSRSAVSMRVKATSADPEVVIKVISPGSNHLHAIAQHFRDLDRGENGALETDDGEPFRGRKAAERLVENWDLDLEATTWRLPYLQPQRRVPPKLVHKILFSMPAGTPPDKLLTAVRAFVLNQFAPTHRYALALHTDDPHPHVHVVVKARSEEGLRLNIRKPMLRRWREQFARHLRALGVAAKATGRTGLRPRAIKLKGIYRPRQAASRALQRV